MIIVVLAMMTFQMSIRNPEKTAEMHQEALSLFNYGVSYYRDLMLDDSLESMQALTLFTIHSRNLPKPGSSWNMTSMVLSRAIELGYHRHATSLPESEQRKLNPLIVEMRKRVFHTVLTMNVHIGYKLGRPMPLRREDIEIDFPLGITDDEFDIDGPARDRTGRCSSWPGSAAFRLTYLYMDLYNDVLSVRKASTEYIQTVRRLKAEIEAWRDEWCGNMKLETEAFTQVSVDLLGAWAAEYLLFLHHPKLIPSTIKDSEIEEQNLEECRMAASSLLRSLQALFKAKSADFTWHSTVGYVLATSITIYIYDKDKQQVTPESFAHMKADLKEWMSVMNSADKFMRKYMVD